MALASSTKILINGKELPDFIDINLQQNIYSPHSFRINCYLFTHEDVNSFLLEKSKEYIGSDITITIEEDSKGKMGPMPGLFFKGVITELNASRSEISDQDYLVISGFSPDILLDESPNTRSFENKSLKQIVEEVLKPYPRNIIKSKVSPKHSGPLPYIVQYNESNYEFLRRMATRYGEWFFYDGEELNFGNPKKEKKDLTLGIDLTDFEFSMRLAPLKFKWIAHDYFKNDKVEESSRPDISHEYGKFAVDRSKKRFSNEGSGFFNSLNVPDKGNTGSILKESVGTKNGAQVESLTFGSGSSTNVMIRVGNEVNIKALNSKTKKEINYGGYLVTSINHQCDEVKNYTNSFMVLPAEAAIPEKADPDAIAYCKTQTAIVTDNSDPEKMGRIKVKFWWQNNNQGTPWLRIVTPYTGGDKNGIYFVPEIEDEVVVGFESDNAEKPYIIGSLYNGKNLPDSEWYNKENEIKSIRTKAGNTIEIIDTKDEEEIILYLKNNKADGGERISILAGSNPVMTLETTGELKIKSRSLVMDVEDSISITTQNKEISMDSGKDISMTANKGKLVSEATEVSVKGKGKVALEAAQFSAKGSATMDIEGAKVAVKGSAMTEIKGGIVKIN